MVFLLIWEFENKCSKRELFFFMCSYTTITGKIKMIRKNYLFLHRNLMQDFSTTEVLNFFGPKSLLDSLKMPNL